MENQSELPPYLALTGMIPASYLAAQYPFPSPVPTKGPEVGYLYPARTTVLNCPIPHKMSETVSRLLASVSGIQEINMPTAAPWPNPQNNPAMLPPGLQSLVQQQPHVFDLSTRMPAVPFSASVQMHMPVNLASPQDPVRLYHSLEPPLSGNEQNNLVASGVEMRKMDVHGRDRLTLNVGSVSASPTISPVYTLDPTVHLTPEVDNTDHYKHLESNLRKNSVEEVSPAKNEHSTTTDQQSGPESLKRKHFQQSDEHGHPGGAEEYRTPRKKSKPTESAKPSSATKKRLSNGFSSGPSTPWKNKNRRDEDVTTPKNVKLSLSTISKLLDQVGVSESMRFAETGNMADFQSLPLKLLSELRIQVSLHSDVLHEISVDMLSPVAYLMDRHITAKSEIALDSLASEKEFESVMVGMEATQIILALMTAHNIPHEIYIEDYLTNALQFVKQHINKTILRVQGSTGSFENSKIKKKKSQALHPQKSNPQFQRGINNIYTKICSIMSKFVDLLASKNCNDEFILEITALSLGTFSYTSDDLVSKSVVLTQLQEISLSMACAVSRRYMKHRQNIIYDIFLFLSKLSTSKRNLRTFKYETRDGEYANSMFVSALFLQLLQSFTSDQTSTTITSTDDQNPPVSESQCVEIQAVRAYESAVTIASEFLGKFFQKASIKGEEETSYKEMFCNFLDDVLKMLHLPEWPAADMVLTRLVVILSEALNNQKLDVTARGLALDSLGLIAKQLKLAGQNVLSVNVLEEIREHMADASSEGEQAQCLCGKGYHGEFMIKCDGGCRKWYHGTCVSIPPTYSGEWMCVACNTRLMSQSQEPNLVEQPEFFIVQKHLSRYLIGNPMAVRANINARSFYHAQWIVDLNKAIQPTSILEEAGVEIVMQPPAFQEEANLRKENFCHFWTANVNANIKEQDIHDAETGMFIDRSDALRAVRCVCDVSTVSLHRYTDTIIRRVLNECLSSTANMRSKAMKNLNGIIVADPKLLENKGVADTVMGRLRDKLPSVREAAVELVGRFMISYPEYTNRYYPEIITRLEDTGKSVRRTVIKILSQVCEAQPENPEIPAICTSMLRRVSDESDSIRALVQKTFEKIWFSPLPSRDIASHDFKVETQRRVSLIKGVVRSIRVNQASPEWMNDLVKGVVKRDEGTSQTIELFSVLTDCLNESVMIIESDIKSASTTVQNMSDDLLDTLLTMLLFTQAIPTVIVPHMTVLSAYLDEGQDRVLIVHNVCLLLDMGFRVAKNIDSKAMQIVENKLREILSQRAWGANAQLVLTSATKCLCTVVSEVTKNYTGLVELLCKFYGYIVKQKLACESTKRFDARASATLNRAIFVLGMLVRYYDFDSSDLVDLYQSRGGDAAAQTLNPGKTRDAVYEVLLFFARGESQVRTTSLNALGCFFVRYPMLMTLALTERLYRKYLQSRKDSLDCRVLQNLKLILTEEEERLHLLNQTGQTAENGGDVMGSYMDGDATALTGAMQSLLPNILETMFSPVAKTRLVALHVIGLCLRQGLVHPMKCIAHIIALEADTEKVIQNKAFDLLKDQHDKHRSFVIPSVAEGIRLSYKLLCSIQQKKDVSGYIVGGGVTRSRASTMSRTYVLVSSTGQMNRRSVFREMLRDFDTSNAIPKDKSTATVSASSPSGQLTKTSPNTSSVGIATNGMQYLLYLAEVVAYLPFAHEDEPLAVWRAMEDMVSVRLHHIARATKAVLGIPTTNMSSTKGEPGVNHEEVPLETADTQCDGDESDDEGAAVDYDMFVLRLNAGESRVVSTDTEYHKVGNARERMSHLCTAMVTISILHHTQDFIRLSFPLSGEGYTRHHHTSGAPLKKSDRGPEKTPVTRVLLNGTNIRTSVGKVEGVGISTNTHDLWTWYSEFVNIVATCSVSRNIISTDSPNDSENKHGDNRPVSCRSASTIHQYGNRAAVSKGDDVVKPKDRSCVNFDEDDSHGDDSNGDDSYIPVTRVARKKPAAQTISPDYEPPGLKRKKSALKK
eukprot:CFRG3562T1